MFQKNYSAGAKHPKGPGPPKDADSFAGRSVSKPKMGPIGSILGHLGASWVHLGAPRDHLLAIPGLSWNQDDLDKAKTLIFLRFFIVFGVHLGGCLGASCGYLGPSWGHLGALLKPSSSQISLIWDLFGSFWAILEPPGSICGPFWSLLGPSWVLS